MIWFEISRFHVSRFNHCHKNQLEGFAPEEVVLLPFSGIFLPWAAQCHGLRADAAGEERRALRGGDKRTAGDVPAVTTEMLHGVLRAAAGDGEGEERGSPRVVLSGRGFFIYTKELSAPS